ncbi:DUF6447 family protein [Marinomonas fungiae]|uniref:Uncharacterized protein n=1 Tax=Marinomonas fungiae TaxID=1137284 RepID=A0A0K6IHI3_9GAMM|nr:DUF6447 family protein [Marinomonas fungiae]CUB02787.1 hypothetical protein Ga0061065_102124 [Marinomonas fungiae]
MATLTVEGKQFDMDDLSEQARLMANSVAFCDSKINQLEAELAMVKMARSGYIQQLVAELPVSEAPKKTTTSNRSSTAKSTTAASKAAVSVDAPVKTTRKRAPAKPKKAPAAE